MNHSSSKSEKNINEGEIDALIIPAADSNNPSLEVTFFDQRIPFFDIDLNQPSPALPSSQDNTPVSFELLPDFTLDRSQRHFEVAPPSFTNSHSETKAPLPAVDELSLPANFSDSNSTRNGRELPAASCSGRSDGHSPSEDVASLQSLPYYPFSPGIAANVFGSSIDQEALEAAIIKLVHSVPLLNEDDLLTCLAEPPHGSFTITPKTLKQALHRLGLETDYKRYRAYITG